MSYRIGIDLGGTKIEGVLVDDNFNTIARKRVVTPQDDYDGIIQSIVELVNRLEKEKRVDSVGICTPGALSKKTMLKNSNTQCLIGKPIKEDIESGIGLDVSLENDANCFALAEATLGAGKNYSAVFGVIMGTGVGGGIVFDKKIYPGRTNIAGEWGHYILHPQGNKCYCGRYGCVETYLSGPALEKKWKNMTGKDEPLEKIVKEISSPKESNWKEEFLENFGEGLATVIDIIDPDIIVLGGGVSNVPFLYTEGKKSVYDKVFSDTVDTPIVQNQLGDSAGVYGAAMLDRS